MSFSGGNKPAAGAFSAAAFRHPSARCFQATSRGLPAALAIAGSDVERLSCNAVVVPALGRSTIAWSPLG
jgi:hypothetical protein